MSFISCLLMLPLQMINDIAFHHKEFQPAGIYTAIALTAIELAIFCYCALAPRFGMQGKQWKELQSRLAVAQENKDRSAEVAGMLAAQAAGRLLKNSDNDVARNLGGAAEIAGAVGAVATAADVLAETSSNAEAMANAYSVTIPSVKKQVLALVIVPAIVLPCVYIPQYVQGNSELQARKAIAAEQLAIAQDALEPVCTRVAADDPYESYHAMATALSAICATTTSALKRPMSTFLLMRTARSRASTTPAKSTQRRALKTTLPVPSRILRRSAPRSMGWTFLLQRRACLRHATCRMSLSRRFWLAPSMKRSVSKRRMTQSSRTTPLTPIPRTSSTTIRNQTSASCSPPRKARVLHSGCHTQTAPSYRR